MSWLWHHQTIQNRDYYQKYSYVVKIQESLDNYRKPVTDLIHPAGLKLYGRYLFQDNNETGHGDLHIANTFIASGVNTSNLIVLFDSALYQKDHVNEPAMDPTIWYNAANTNQYANISNTITYSTLVYGNVTNTVTNAVNDALTVPSFSNPAATNILDGGFVAEVKSPSLPNGGFFHTEGSQTTPGLSRGALHNSSLANNNADLSHVCDFKFTFADGISLSGLINPIAALQNAVKNGKMAAANAIRAAISQLQQRNQK